MQMIFLTLEKGTQGTPHGWCDYYYCRHRVEGWEVSAACIGAGLMFVK